MASSHFRTQRKDRAWPTTTTARRIDPKGTSRIGRAVSSATADPATPHAAIARTARRDPTSPAAATARIAPVSRAAPSGRGGRTAPTRAAAPTGRTGLASRVAVVSGRAAPTVRIDRCAPSVATAPVSARVATAPGTPAGPSCVRPATAAGMPPARATPDAPSVRPPTAMTRGLAATIRRSPRTCVPVTSTRRRGTSCARCRRTTRTPSRASVGRFAGDRGRPAEALRHALAAGRRAGRVGVVRESVAIAAYATGDFALALRELRTFRRISGPTTRSR